jgi:hypothetical protein
VVENVGYYPLAPDQLAKSAALLAAKGTGTAKK